MLLISQSFYSIFPSTWGTILLFALFIFYEDSPLTKQKQWEEAILQGICNCHWITMNSRREKNLDLMLWTAENEKTTPFCIQRIEPSDTAKAEVVSDVLGLSDLSIEHSRQRSISWLRHDIHASGSPLEVRKAKLEETHILCKHDLSMLPDEAILNGRQARKSAPESPTSLTILGRTIFTLVTSKSITVKMSRTFLRVMIGTAWSIWKDSQKWYVK